MENINENNYEIWMIDYLEGNLDNDKQRLFSIYLDKNPDLRTELELFQLSILKPEKELFDNKYLLLKSTDPMIDMPESDYLLIKQIEEGLTDKEHDRLIKLGKLYPKLKNDYKTYKLTKLRVPQIIFPKKSSLKRKNIIPYLWTTIGSVAAAAILLFILIKPENIVNKPDDYYTDLITDTETIINEIIIEPIQEEAFEKTEPITLPKTQNIKIIANNISTETETETENEIEVATKPQEEELLLSKIETIELIEKPQFQSLLQVEKVNSYEKCLSLMIPQYLENHQLLTAYKIDNDTDKIDRERGFFIKAGERLLSRLTSRNIIFEWS
jgi:hypothetical protein